MSRLVTLLTLVLAFTTCSSAAFAEEPFTGSWTIDLRTTSERQRGAECGVAEFVLTQTGEAISGSHSFATIDCGRINEGGAVHGVVVGHTAVLVVASGRNDAIAMGTAKLVRGKLQWRTVNEIKASTVEGDSSLILGEGTLTRVRSN
jgi:hypothetical protein